ncbi:MAG: neuromedin U [Gemmatimonadota bacterium]|nr:MAG: neuromedin U [Gemmatimonadota bacterium]
MTVFRTVGMATLALAISTGVEAQQSADELAQKAANPIADLMSIPFQNNVDFGLGPYDRTRNVLNIQPVIPLAEGKLITRTIIPFVWLPDVTAESGSFSSGLSDIVFTAFYVPQSGSFMWGVGPVLEIPTGGENRGTQKWSLGGSAVALSVQGPWTLGVLANNVWSVAGDADRDAVNKGLLQYFIVRQLGNGWYVNSAPVITVNWKAAEGQKWVVPFGVGGGKLVFLGKLPVNVQSQVFYNVVKPDIGPDWQLRLQVQVLLPAPGSR